MARRRKPLLPPVSLGGVFNEPALPLPFVEYPELYGTLFRFGDSPSGPFHFCSCSVRALRNLARLNLEFPRPNNFDPARLALLDSLMVPTVAATETIGWSFEEVASMQYAERVCHRCNCVPPTRRWCHEMYGDQWKQSYGWFPYLAALEGGVDPWNIDRFLLDEVPTEVRADLNEYLPLKRILLEAAKERAGASDDRTRLTRRRARAIASRVMRHFTSEARVAFGFKRVGEGWVSETILFRLIQAMLPHERIIRHYRPEWLGGLELDIFVPSLNVGIEYQGEQHSSPVEHWGGEGAFERQQIRDSKKRDLCRQEGCRLVEVWAGTDLTDISIRRVLMESGVSLPQVT